MRISIPATVAATLLFQVLGLTVSAADTPALAKAPFNAKQADAFQQQWAKHIGKELVHTNSVGMKLKLIPPGEFMMGMTQPQVDEMMAVMNADEKLRQWAAGKLTWSQLMMPSHRVRITKPYYLGSTEVTVGQYRQFVEETGYETGVETKIREGKARPWEKYTWKNPVRKPAHDDKPVVQVSWEDCVAFCKWLSKKEGVEYHLPTEAQWEYACRAGTTSLWHFGSFKEFDLDKGLHVRVGKGDADLKKGQRIVAQGKPNAFGLYDMHGNVWEFVGDYWHRLTYKESPLNDPTGPAVQSEKGDSRRIIRGGSYDFGGVNTASPYRMRIAQTSFGHHHSSFRIAMRIKGAKGVPPAVDPDAARRAKKRDPGADSAEVVAALKAAATKDKRPKELTIDIADGIKMDFVLIPAGTFLMGSDKGPKDEGPIHRVVVSKPFYMAKYEVTQSQWELLMGKDKRLEEFRKHDTEMTGPTKAMNDISWIDCQDFIGKLKTKAPGHAFALPTEAQWEYACRAGSSSEYHFGDDATKLGQYAWFEGNMNWVGKPNFGGRAFYHDVGKKKPNAYGLYDMHGGVWEWCADWYDPDYYYASPVVNPTGPKATIPRVARRFLVPLSSIRPQCVSSPVPSTNQQRRRYLLCHRFWLSTGN